MSTSPRKAVHNEADDDSMGLSFGTAAAKISNDNKLASSSKQAEIALLASLLSTSSNPASTKIVGAGRKIPLPESFLATP